MLTKDLNINEVHIYDVKVWMPIHLKIFGAFKIKYCKKRNKKILFLFRPVLKKIIVLKNNEFYLS
jgi:hypothetical protein